MPKNDPTINDVLVFLQKHMATKQDLTELRQEMNSRFETVDKRFKILDKRFDDINNRFAEQAVSLSFIQTELQTLRKDFAALAKRTREDADVLSKEILKLKSRLNAVEQKLKKIKTPKLQVA